MSRVSQEVVLIRGLPGSGKSTLAAQMCQHSTMFAHHEADQYFVGNDGVFRFNGAQKKAAHEWCYMQASKSLQLGKSVVISNTFTRFWEMEPYYRLAAAFGCNVSVIICRGQYQNIHGVTDEHIEYMRQRWEE